VDFSCAVHYSTVVSEDLVDVVRDVLPPHLISPEVCGTVLRLTLAVLLLSSSCQNLTFFKNRINQSIGQQCQGGHKREKPGILRDFSEH